MSGPPPASKPAAPAADSHGYGVTGAMRTPAQGYAGGAMVAPGEEAYAAESQPRPDPMRMSRILKVTGLPVEDGHLRWPVALQALASPGTEERDLQEQIDALFEEAAARATAGLVNFPLTQEMARAVHDYRDLALAERPQRYVIPLADWAESQRFVNKLGRATRLLEAGFGTSSGEARLKSK
jgi:hypothetical protein